MESVAVSPSSSTESPPSSSAEVVLLDVEGMKCGGCVRAVERTLQDQPGVQEASVNLVTRSAWLRLDPAALDPQQALEGALEALRSRGFSAQPRQSGVLNANAEPDRAWGWWNQWRQLMVALVLLLLSVLGHLAEAGTLSLPLIGTLPFHAGLATVALFGPGRSILRSGWAAAISGVPSMDTLVSLGVGSAYLASVVALVWPAVGWPCFFNEPVMLLGFVLLGRFLEERARRRTGRALKELAALQPSSARLVMADGSVRDVPVEMLRPGERIELLAGDRIPVDGVIEEGYSAVDLSSLTGEPLPVDAGPGTELSSGCLNLEATLVMEVRRVGRETALARIISLVEQAQARRAPIQGLADRVAGRFCYGVVSLALFTFLFWWLIGSSLWPQVLDVPVVLMDHGHGHGVHQSLGAAAQTPFGLGLQLAIAVLVVACPCALGLATPTVITVSSGLAARQGWLFRGGDVIERSAEIERVVFDKTGTLTLGRPLVEAVLLSDDPSRTIQLAASLEQTSRHPLAHALLQEAQRLNLPLLPVQDSRMVPGAGMEGTLADAPDPLRVGSLEWLRSQGVEWSAHQRDAVEAAQTGGQSLVAVSLGHQPIGLVAIDDRLRPDAVTALQRLRSQGLSLGMLSGDRRQAVERVGQTLGIQADEMAWQLLPDQKLERLECWRQSQPVAMVGDGINDAPALAAADLGIAVGTGTQIAQDTADLVLMGDRLEALPEALGLARRTMRKIRQNLVWAFGYNLIALPVAAGVLLPGFGILLSPPLAALLMALSSVSVVVNALSLRLP
ncbi:MAG: heavy metal translocating P-type ATPase [Synechococcus sp.]|uniref:heavy metal translocating P-type ATPase n=1 Tax=Synechococcus sp. BMK-MC-1 TaxID=1442551 RepID=UPI002102C5C9|nr:heavy metal translocating P-type ATPase [Synechococcus sp. BMK-MC-1]